MRVYHFLKADHGLHDLRHRRLRISRIIELNDPFEFLGIDLSDRTFRQALEETKRQLSDTKGLLCFSKTWRNPVLWGNYADKHRGLCLPGFPIWLWYFWPSDQSSRLDCRGFPEKKQATEGDTQWVNYRPSPFSSRSTDF